MQDAQTSTTYKHHLARLYKCKSRKSPFPYP